MKKNKNNLFLKISVFISIAIHVVAIASINHLEIKSSLASKNIMFSNKAAAYNSKKNINQILNIVLQKKQKNILTQIKCKKTELPSSESTAFLKNDFNLKKDPLSCKRFSFPPTESTKNEFYKLVERKNILPGLDNENSLLMVAFQTKDSYKSEDEITNETADLAISLPEVEKNTKLTTCFNYPLNEKDKSKFQFANFANREENNLDALTKLKQKKIKLFPYNFSLIHMPELSDLTTLSYKDFFDIDVTFAPNLNEKGFIFAITLLPKHSMKLKRLKQNVFFLVDRSNSIQKDRLTSTRHAITSSLPLLGKDDSFNILAFDTKLDVLSTQNLSPDENVSLSRAKSFLRKQNIGSFFSSTNFSIPLFKILNSNVKNDEVNIAILLSNGDGLNKFKNYRIFNDWTKLNGGNLSLYTLGLESDKNLSILELFSFFNKGKLIPSSTNRGIKRKLQKLLKSISYPIAKDIVSNAICLESSANIKLYPLSDQSPNLYMNEPYVILGTTDKLTDFTIFVQGKGKDNFFNLKKHICFDQAKQGGKILQKELAVKKASKCYEEFLADSNPNHLKEANHHLEPFAIEPAFR
ncbi:MAG: hypothetical protein K940chlam5_00115 [Candidatus Anoxychlamydiales bacterium]|nr:hypothetical protein [Candidatus Anoxychlamydiales bacterium]